MAICSTFNNLMKNNYHIECEGPNKNIVFIIWRGYGIFLHRQKCIYLFIYLFVFLSAIICNIYFFQCGLPTLEECKELAENTHAEGEIFQAVKYYLLSTEPEKALPIGITFVKGECLRDSVHVSKQCHFQHAHILQTMQI